MAMAGIRVADQRLFPLHDISSVVRLFKQQLDTCTEPDLALLSIVVGAVENSLTCNRSLTTLKETASDETADKVPAIDLEFHIVEALYSKFHSIILGSIDLSLYGGSKYATRELVKKVSDVIWNTLSRSYYKDRAHLQSLYSYLTGNKLDCFGVAFAVVAGFQVLGYHDVHLALSEDHAWVVFGENGNETAEVTWHGKGNEDKRGQPIGTSGGSRTWLYVNGQPVICDRHMEVAALVSSMNPSLSVTSEAKEVAELQKELLWLLYDLGHLDRYPMALGNLGDLEEISPTQGRPSCSTLFEQAVNSARIHYNNQHVYPYTYQGGYFFRHKLYKDAFESWANAADVIRQYNYSRDDEELYKELMDIANELIPHVMKAVSSGHSAYSILRDPECFAHLLRLYDGICQWEEGSVMPVLHIGWARPLVNTIAKFDADVRSQLVIDAVDQSCDDETIELRYLLSSGHSACSILRDPECFAHLLRLYDGICQWEEGSVVPVLHIGWARPLVNTIAKFDADKGEKGNSKPDSSSDGVLSSDLPLPCVDRSVASGENLNNNNNNYCKTQDTSSANAVNAVHPSIEALAAACGEKILNPDFLLQGDGEPFVGSDRAAAEAAPVVSKTGPNGWSCGGGGAGGVVSVGPGPSTRSPGSAVQPTGVVVGEDGRPRVALLSRKMRGLKDLLLYEKLNTQAISLQLTAQSQVQVTRKNRVGSNGAESSLGSRPKRTRRD